MYLDHTRRGLTGSCTPIALGIHAPRMRQVPVTAVGTVSPIELEELQRQLADQRTLGDVMTWLSAQKPPRSVSDILTQDEYTHDVIVEWSERTYLNFDAT